MTPNQKALHEQAIYAAQNFRRAESELLEIIQKLDDQKVFRALGYSSLFQYCLDELKLSEATTYNFINVSRKAKEVPLIKEKMKSGEISVSKVRKILPIVNQENAKWWLEKVEKLPCRQLEKEVAKIAPQVETPEKTKYLSEKRLKLEINISEELYNDFVRIKDILSQKSKRAVTTEEALQSMARCFKEKHDPLVIATRVLAKKKPNPKGGCHVTSNVGKLCKTNGEPIHETNPKRKVDSMPSLVQQRQPIPAKIKHQVIYQSQAQCEHVHNNGRRCNSKRWLEIHHKLPVKKGGNNRINNLQLLCFHHHRSQHEQVG